MTALVYRPTTFQTAPWVYRPAFLKHLHNLAVSDFYAPDLDADDYAFLEKVKVRGSANSSLPETGIASLEELDFWQLPYTTERGVVRRAGPVQRRRQELPEERELRLARRTLRGARKAIADAELERERREQEAAKANRIRREVLDDIEWARAAPRSRHYVPEWKRPIEIKSSRHLDAVALDAVEREQPAKPAPHPMERAAREAAREERARALAYDAAQRMASEARFAEQEAARQVRDQQRWAEAARNMIDRIIARQPTPVERTKIKQTIMMLVRSTIPVPWEPDQLARAVGCTEAELDGYVKEMLRDGELRQVEGVG